MKNMPLDEDELKKKKGILRAYEQTLDAFEEKLNSEEKRIAALKETLGTKKTVSAWGIVLLIFLVILTAVTIFGFFNKNSGGTGTFYVKVTTANIRKCPAANCAVIDTFPLNSEINAPYKTLSDAPEWVEISYTDDKGEAVTGYISKTMLSVSQVKN